MTSSNVLEAQIAALVRQLEETKEAEQLEIARREAEAVVEKACKEEEQRRLQAGAEAKHARHDAEECRVEQEQQEREEEEAARRRRLCKESTLTLLAAPEMELPRSKGKGPELAP